MERGRVAPPTFTSLGVYLPPGLFSRFGAKREKSALLRNGFRSAFRQRRESPVLTCDRNGFHPGICAQSLPKLCIARCSHVRHVLRAGVFFLFLSCSTSEMCKCEGRYPYFGTREKVPRRRYP